MAVTESARLRALNEIPERIMVSKCANPGCNAHMKFMHKGRVFVVRRHSSDEWWAGDGGPFGAPSGAQMECFWLCEACIHEMRVDEQGELVPTKLMVALPLQTNLPCYERDRVFSTSRP